MQVNLKIKKKQFMLESYVEHSMQDTTIMESYSKMSIYHFLFTSCLEWKKLKEW